MRKAYSYIRMSNVTQSKGDSRRRQLVLSKEYADANDLEIVDHIDDIQLEDIGVSGFKGLNATKGVLALFLKALETQAVPENSVLLVENLDRLSRDDVTKALSQFLNILHYGIEIVTLSDGKKYTQKSVNDNYTELLTSILFMMRANDESVTKSRRVKAAWAHKRANALLKPITKSAPAWLKFDDATNSFLTLPDRVEIVNLIFHMCTKTCGLWAITRHLNDLKIPTFGRSIIWHKSYVTKILKNRSVLGELQPTELIEGKKMPLSPILNYYPQIIDEALFIAAQAAISGRKVNTSGKKGTNFSNLFSGLLRCGLCGSKMSVRNRGKDPKNGGLRIVCSGKLQGADCSTPEIKITTVESSILKHLQEINFSELLGVENKNQAIEKQLAQLQISLNAKSEQLHKAIEIGLAEDLNDNVKKLIAQRLNSIDTEVEALKQAINIENKKLIDNAQENNLLQTSQLKEALELVGNNTDDYYLRSTINQMLNKIMLSIEVFVDDPDAQLWELDIDDRIVKQYLKLKALPITSFEKVIQSMDFKRYLREASARFVIKYKTGAVRHVIASGEASLYNRQLN